MKYRQGFVSNSSSSSFLVAIRKPTKNTIDAVKMIEFVAKHTEKNPLWKEVFGINDKKKQLKEELDELNKDISFLKEEIKFWDDTGKNKEFDIWLGKLRDHNMIGTLNKERVRSCRFNDEIQKEVKALAARPCMRMADNIAAAMDRAKEEVDKLNEYMVQLKDLKDSEWKIYSFEEDKNWSDNVVSKAVEDLVEQKQAIILSKVTS